MTVEPVADVLCAHLIRWSTILDSKALDETISLSVTNPRITEWLLVGDCYIGSFQMLLDERYWYEEKILLDEGHFITVSYIRNIIDKEQGSGTRVSEFLAVWVIKRTVCTLHVDMLLTHYIMPHIIQTKHLFFWEAIDMNEDSEAVFMNELLQLNVV